MTLRGRSFNSIIMKHDRYANQVVAIKKGQDAALSPFDLPAKLPLNFDTK